MYNSRNLSLFTYSHNNPMVLVDPDGNNPLIAIYLVGASAAMYIQTLGASPDTAMDIAETGEALKEGRYDEAMVGGGAILVGGFTAKSGMDIYKKGKVVIGENMKRVKNVAKKIGAKVFGGETKAGNKGWVTKTIKSEKEIIDIGPDFTRRKDWLEETIQRDLLFIDEFGDLVL